MTSLLATPYLGTWAVRGASRLNLLQAETNVSLVVLKTSRQGRRERCNGSTTDSRAWWASPGSAL